MNDPKFGYHFLWLAPIGISLVVGALISDFISSKIHEMKIKKYRKDVDINDVAKRSGL